MCTNRDATDRLGGLGEAKQVRAGPILLFGIANQWSVSEYGMYKVSLPLHDGKTAVMSGICLDQVSAVFLHILLQVKLKMTAMTLPSLKTLIFPTLLLVN